MVVDEPLGIPSSSFHDIPSSRGARQDSNIDYQWNSVMLDMRTAILDGINGAEAFGRLAPVIRNELEGIVDSAILQVGDRYGFRFDDRFLEGSSGRSKEKWSSK